MRIPLRLSPQGRIRKLLIPLAIALVSAGLVVSAEYLPGTAIAVTILDQVFYDSLYRLRPIEDQTYGPVVMVVADQRSLTELSRQGIGKTSYGWPWPRLFWGSMLGYFNKCGAKAVAFDMVFTEPSVYNAGAPDDAEFAKAVERSKIPIIFGSRVDDDGTWEPFVPPVKHPVLGAVNVGKSVVYRVYHPVVNGFPSLASRVANAVGIAPVADSFRLHYYGPYESPDGQTTFRYVSASNVLRASLPQKDPKADVKRATGVDPEWFKDKIVLVGATAVGTYDLKASPLSNEYPGVEIQATAIANMLAGQQVERISKPWTAVAAVLAAMVGAVGTVLPRRVSIKLGLAAFVVAALFATAIFLFVSHHIRWLPLAVPILSLILGTIGSFAWSYLAEGRQRQFVLKALSQYISPAVASEIDRDPASLKLGGERREMTVMFTDIRGFTDLSERLEQHQLTQLLNFYLDEMSSLVLQCDGTLDKYIGDAIMSFWNAPLYQAEHAILACRAALAIERREYEIQPKLREIAGEKMGDEELLTRVGINTGPMVFGNMGSTHKFSYTVIGDAVNLASRLEGANKFYNSRILIAHPTAELAKAKFLVRQLDVLRVKGKLVPMAVYELMAELPGDADQQFRKTEYELAFHSYQSQQWEQAQTRLAALCARFPSDKPARVLLDRAMKLREHPPEGNWDGVYDPKQK
jgi:adenylate cyclase